MKTKKLITKRVAALVGLNLLFVGSGLFAQAGPPAASLTIRAQEVTAINIAVTHFKRLNPASDLNHYDIEITRRRRELQIAFIADDPDRSPPQHARTGGGTIYGPDMTYRISIPQMKIIRYNFHR